MAFVSFQNRFKYRTPDSDVGPGAYEVQSERKFTPSRAPFLSKAPRSSLEKDNKKAASKTASSLCMSLANNQLLQEDPIELHLRDKKFLLTTDKTSSYFKSDSNRFAYKRPADVPGPGYYDLASTLKTKSPNSFQMSSTNSYLSRDGSLKPSLEVLKGKRDHSFRIPSIPANPQRFGYTMSMEEQKLVPNEYPEKIHHGTKEDSVGPGEYNIKGSFDFSSSKKTGKAKGDWSRSKSQRLKAVPGNVIGPAYYDPEFSYEPRYKRENKSSAFLSSSTRSESNSSKVSYNQKLKEKYGAFSGENDLEVDEEFDEMPVRATPTSSFRFGFRFEMISTRHLGQAITTIQISTQRF